VHVNGNYLIRRIYYSLISKNFRLDFIDVNYILYLKKKLKDIKFSCHVRIIRLMGVVMKKKNID